MHPYLNIAIQAARKAGQIITRSFDNHDKFHITEKKTNDFVTAIDKQCEDVILQDIRKAYPDHAILAEESGATGEHNTVWIIDPLDGTTNFIHSIPHVAVSIAVQIHGIIEHGVIYDPFRDELFTASRGRGASCNQTRLRIERKSGLEHALIGTGFPFRHKERTAQFIHTFSALFPIVSDLRRSGAAALDLAYVAAGRLDGFWEWELAAWDIAAGGLMIREAGGMICDVDSSENYLQSGNVVAGNSKLLKEMLQLLKENESITG